MTGAVQRAERVLDDRLVLPGRHPLPVRGLEHQTGLGALGVALGEPLVQQVEGPLRLGARHGEVLLLPGRCHGGGDHSQHHDTQPHTTHEPAPQEGPSSDPIKKVRHRLITPDTARQGECVRSTRLPHSPPAPLPGIVSGRRLPLVQSHQHSRLLVPTHYKPTWARGGSCGASAAKNSRMSPRRRSGARPGAARPAQRCGP